MRLSDPNMLWLFDNNRRTWKDSNEANIAMNYKEWEVVDIHDHWVS